MVVEGSRVTHNDALLGQVGEEIGFNYNTTELSMASRSVAGWQRQVLRRHHPGDQRPRSKKTKRKTQKEERKERERGLIEKEE
jgi:hypothetical protein